MEESFISSFLCSLKRSALWTNTRLHCLKDHTLTTYTCHRHGIGDKEKMMGLCVAIVIVNFGSNASKCAEELDISSVYAQWFSH